MKKTFTYIIAVSFLSASNALHGADRTPDNTVRKEITVSCERFSSPLVEKWIQEFTSLHPEIHITITNGTDKKPELRFIANIHTAGNKEESPRNTAYVGRYALLPVTTVHNPLLRELKEKQLDEKNLKRFFFRNDIPEETGEGKKHLHKEEITVYSGMGSSSGTTAFAAHFGESFSMFRGRHIAGDDIYLLTAIEKDKKAITFNYLSYLFDMESRLLKQQLVILPLDVKREQQEILTTGNLDRIISLLENTEIDLIPIEHIGFVFEKQESVITFLHWILNEGQQYNHDFGFLTLDHKLAQQEVKQLQTQLLTDR